MWLIVWPLFQKQLGLTLQVEKWEKEQKGEREACEEREDHIKVQPFSNSNDKLLLVQDLKS